MVERLMSKKSLGIFLPLVILLASGLEAQSNEFIDQVLQGSGITGKQAAYLVLVASENMGDDADAERAFEMLSQFGWVPSGLVGDQTISTAQYAYILMKAFGVQGGLFYSWFPSPRYAYRELRKLVVIQGNTDPDQDVTGFQAMRMIGRMFDVKGVSQ